jgi:hypothetical protein
MLRGVLSGVLAAGALVAVPLAQGPAPRADAPAAAAAAGPAAASSPLITNFPVTGESEGQGIFQVWASHGAVGVRAYFAAVAKKSRVRWVRFVFSWDSVQDTQAGALNWRMYDVWINAARAQGLRIDAILMDTPAWAVSPACRNPASTQYLCAPNPLPYGRFAGLAAKRYRGGPGSPGRVDAWEIWNEPNCGGGGDSEFAPHDPTLYARVVRAAYPRIKRGSRALVLAGGDNACATDPARQQWDSRDWLQAMYAHGARRFFDALVQHPYCWSDDWQDASHRCPRALNPWSAFAMMTNTFASPTHEYSGQVDSHTGRSLRRIMQDNGDGAKPIWITEFGAPSAGEPFLSQQNQARELTSAYTWLSHRPRGEFGPIFAYTYQDVAAGSLGSETAPTEYHFGLVDAAGATKKALSTWALAGLAARRAATSDQCPGSPPVGYGW